MDALAVATLILAALCLVVLLVLLFRNPAAAFADRVRAETDRINTAMRDDLRANREEGASSARQLREEITSGMRTLEDGLLQRLGEDAQQELSHLKTFSDALTESSERSEQRLRDMQGTLTAFNESLATQLRDIMSKLHQQLGELATRNETKLEAMRTTLEGRLTHLQQQNEAKLEHIRQTVDERLHATLEQRLGESFKLVSDRLEQVHTGLGEMKSLAVGVGDLKKILSNVKTRGTWGEVQLGNLLEQTLTAEQYVRNFSPDEGNSDRVEFAIRLPGRDADGTPVWLPIDSKFPHEEYQRLLDAQERGDAVAAEANSAALEQGIRNECKKISGKYLRPPLTTDFAILFLPTEGLFAELLRRPGLTESLQRDYRVVVSGPTTLTALLMSLQMGFRTLAIEQRSSEVWKVLGAVKTEFGKFGGVLDKVQKKLIEASNTIEQAQQRSRVMERKLRPADELPAPDAVSLLGLDPDEVAAPAEDAIETETE